MEVGNFCDFRLKSPFISEKIRDRLKVTNVAFNRGSRNLRGHDYELYKFKSSLTFRKFFSRPVVDIRNSLSSHMVKAESVDRFGVKRRALRPKALLREPDCRTSTVYTTLEECQEGKDLGVLVSNNLKVGPQCNQAFQKANRCWDS